MRRHPQGFIPFCLILLVWTGISAIAQDHYGILNPQAPSETAQFDFLVGKWHADIYYPGIDGITVHATAEWAIRYILDGYALQDEWISYSEEGEIEEHGTMFRTWDVGEGKWTIVEQSTSRLKFNYMNAEKVGDTMVMYEMLPGKNGSIRARRVFHNITADSFEWRSDLTRDDGKTWISRDVIMKVRRID